MAKDTENADGTGALSGRRAFLGAVPVALLSATGDAAAQTSAAGPEPRAPSPEIVSVWDFYTPDMGADHTTAIQAFFDHVATHRVRKAVLSGDLNISRTVTLNCRANTPPSYGAGATTAFEWTATLRATRPMEVMLQITETVIARFEGRLRLIGMGGEPFATRTCMTGVRMTFVTGCQFDGFHVENFYYAGVEVTRQPSNNNVANLGDIYAKRCGSGSGRDGASTSLLSAWRGPVNAGGANSVIQHTAIDVDVLPPPYLDARQVIALIGGEPYFVKAIDRAQRQLRVYPWTDAKIASGTLTYIFGAACVLSGNDSNFMQIGMVTSLRGGCALELGCLYGPVVDRVLAESNGTAIRIAASPDGQVYGGFIGSIYCEGNTIDVLNVGASTYGVTFGANSALDFAKCKTTTEARGGRNELTRGSGFSGINMLTHNGMLSFEKRASIHEHGAAVLDFNEPGRARNSVYRWDDMEISLAPVREETIRLWGYDGGLITVLGSGPAGGPTGEIAVGPPRGETINGQPKLALSGFVGPLTLAFSYDPSTRNWRVHPVTGKARGLGGTGVFGDADAVLTPGRGPAVIRFTKDLTAPRKVTLVATGARAGDRIRITRSGGGAFGLAIGPGLKTLPARSWCDVDFDGQAWLLSASGGL